MATVKCVVVGDGFVGKTCMLITYTSGRFPAGYLPTVFETYAKSVHILGNEYTMTLVDTAGQEDYDRLRPLGYQDTDVFVLCFSVDSRDSFQNIQDKWFQEVRHFCPLIPILLVGTKSDLRDDPAMLQKLRNSHRDMVTWDMGKQLAKEIKAAKYMECSAKTMQNLEEVFNEALQAALHPPKSRRKCTLL